MVDFVFARHTNAVIASRFKFREQRGVLSSFQRLRSISAFDTVTEFKSPACMELPQLLLSLLHACNTSPCRRAGRVPRPGRADREQHDSAWLESLCKLLRYLAEHSIDHPGVALKEYQIATEVFGRPADFDPQVDSTIRVQAGRLRSKLTAYYSSEGADDSVVLEMPKGSYLLSFHHRADVKPACFPATRLRS